MLLSIAVTTSKAVETTFFLDYYCIPSKAFVAGQLPDTASQSKIHTLGELCF